MPQLRGASPECAREHGACTVYACATPRSALARAWRSSAAARTFARRWRALLASCVLITTALIGLAVRHHEAERLRHRKMINNVRVWGGLDYGMARIK